VVLVEHADHDAKERRDDRHASIYSDVPPRSVQHPRSAARAAAGVSHSGPRQLHPLVRRRPPLWFERLSCLNHISRRIVKAKHPTNASDEGSVIDRPTAMPLYCRRRPCEGPYPHDALKAIGGTAGIAHADVASKGTTAT